MSDPNGDHAHRATKVLSYGVEVCWCGAVHGVDDRWRTVSSDSDGHVTIGAPEGVCRHPYAIGRDDRLVCGSCGADGGAYPVTESRLRR